MANDTENFVKNTLAKVAEYVEDVATMTVRTEFTRIDSEEADSFKQAKPAALTVIKLDGDCLSVIPMRQAAEGRVEIDAELLEVHRQNVATAIEYRARIMESLLNAFQSRFK
ncbi:MAG: hypothetical protein LC803_22665 [Acidobacteria bacterium]|nr:hypothetical protein [Acidobacteriota bacterium]